MPSPGEALRDEIAALGAWLRGQAWPLWLARGIDRAHGAFHEWLAPGGACDADYRRLRVAARQTQVFCLAARENFPGAAEAARLGLRFLRERSVHPAGGHAARFTRGGAALPGPRDTYDHAFVLLAYAAAQAVADQAELHAAARGLLAWMDGALAHPAGGYREALPDVLPRRQNPHMHMLEALHESFRAFGDAVFLDRARALTALFLDRLFDAETGAVPEYYDAHWKPRREAGAFLVEPGHHCEWAWLLSAQAVLAGPDARIEDAAAALLGFVDRFGAAPAGGLVNLLDSTGRVRDAGTRLWPQAERLRAELGRPDADPARQRAAARELRRRLRPDGTWHERLHPDGTPVPAPSPATSLYHVTGAILDAERWLSGAD